MAFQLLKAWGQCMCCSFLSHLSFWVSRNCFLKLFLTTLSQFQHLSIDFCPLFDEPFQIPYELVRILLHLPPSLPLLALPSHTIPRSDSHSHPSYPKMASQMKWKNGRCWFLFCVSWQVLWSFGKHVDSITHACRHSSCRPAMTTSHL